jgi:tRNA(fMet)-specific endonuclease VapC
MTLAYLVDTDWAVHWLHSNQRIRQRMEELRGQGLALSPLSPAELWEGVHYSRDPLQSERGLRDFLRHVSFVPIEEETCKLFGMERGRLRAEGKRVADFDLMIAMTARQHDLTLLTNNRRHFEHIEGLRIESLD